MLIYLIDGNNLYYSIPKICDSPKPRRALIDFIRANRITGSPRNGVIIVFDGYESDEVFGENEYKIIYGKNRSADDAIKDFLARAKNKKQIVVVSDDHSVILSARGEGAKVMKTAEFAGLGKAKKTKKAKKNYDEDYDEEKRKKITDELEAIWVKRGKMGS